MPKRHRYTTDAHDDDTSRAVRRLLHVLLCAASLLVTVARPATALYTLSPEESAAKLKVRDAIEMVIQYEYRPGRGKAPDGMTFTRLWRAKHPTDFNSNPWDGGAPTDIPSGIVALPDLLADCATGDAGGCPSDNPSLPTVPGHAGALIYARIREVGKGRLRYLNFSDGQDSARVERARHAVIALYNAEGVPWFDPQSPL
jgi:hypothetical protein